MAYGSAKTIGLSYGDNGRPAIALDIDGVLNTRATGQVIDRDCAENLDTILANTGARILLISSWRKIIHNGDMTLDGFELALRMAGVSNARMGGTLGDGADRESTRYQQIVRWMKRNAHRAPLVILDDEQVGEEINRLVLVNPNHGLTAEDASRAIEILKSQESVAAGR